MKKILLILLAVIAVFGNVPVWASSTTAVPVEAQVPMMLELSYWIRSCPSDSTPYGTGSRDVTDMSFGQLVWNDQNSIWLPDKYFTVFLVATTSGRPYQIRQNCTGFVSAATGQTFNKNLLMTPDYKEADLFTANNPSTAQGPMGSGDKLGSSALSVGNEQLIFDSSTDRKSVV